MGLTGCGSVVFCGVGWGGDEVGGGFADGVAQEVHEVECHGGEVAVGWVLHVVFPHFVQCGKGGLFGVHRVESIVYLLAFALDAVVIVEFVILVFVAFGHSDTVECLCKVALRGAVGGRRLYGRWRIACR